MPIDPNVFDKIRTYPDYQKADQAFQLQKALQQQQIQTGNIDAQTKANIYATQVISAATATGDQGAYDQARRTLAGNGIDISTWAPDVQTGAQQAQAARLAQSPLGTLFNAQQKVIGNNIAATSAMGSTDNGFMQPVPTISPITGDVSITPQRITAPAPIAASDTAPRGNPNIKAGTPAGDAALNDLFASNEPPAQPVVLSSDAPQAATSSTMRFSPRAQRPDETNAAYQASIQKDFEAYKASPQYIQEAKAAEEKGKNQAEAQQGSTVQNETMQRLNQNLDALKELNKDLPEYGGILPVGVKATGQLIMGASKGYDANQKWNEINQQQILNAIGDLIKGGQLRGNRFIEQIVSRGYAIDPNAPASTRADQIEILRNEIKNAATQAQNINSSYTGQSKGDYVPTLPQNNALKPGSTQTSPTGTYMFNGGDPADKASWKKVK